GQIAHGIRQAIHASACWCFAYDQQKEEIIASSPTAKDQTTRGNSLAGAAVFHAPRSVKNPLFPARQLRQDSAASAHTPWIGSSEPRRLVATVGDHDNQEMAFLAVRTANRPFTPWERGLFETLTQLVKSALAAHRLLAEQSEIRQRADDVATIIGHELRTPMAGAMGYLQLAARRLAANDSEAASKAVNAAIQISRALERQLDDLLESSRISLGHVTLNPVTFDLVDLIENLTNSVRVSSPDHGITVTSPPSLTVRGDILRLRRVLENLLSNAVKFSPSGTNIRLDVQTATDGAMIVISDEGPGIAAEHLNRIFDRYYQIGDPSCQSGGLGMGLSLAQQIVRAHGGKIWCTSEVGRGSNFYVTIPLGPGPSASLNPYSPPL
ncbi:MAG TPA: HAMP domain-containing sensor histidine kinase, partial [Chloroflexota bacterium]|nr:HAMP domain-containing sensor histidine kinase [Chloroflexota bacterium]